MGGNDQSMDGEEKHNGLPILPSLPKGWCWTTLEEIADIEGGITKDQKRKKTATMTEVPYLRVANVQRGFLDLREIKTILADEEEAKALRLQRGDILFTEGGDRDKLGRGWVWTDEIDNCIHQNHIFRARVSMAFVEPKLVSYHGNSFGQDWFTKVGKQTTNLASINKGILKKFPVPLAPINEQHRIVAKIEELFSDLDAGVAALERVRANLKRYRAAVLKAAVEGKLTADWRAQHPDTEPASVLLERILTKRRRKWEEDQLAKFESAGKQPPKGWQAKYKVPENHNEVSGSELPDRWGRASVEQITTKVVDGVHKKPDYVAKGVPFVTVRNLTAGPGISFERLKYITEEDHQNFIKRANPERGDLLISKDGTLGVTRVIQTDTQFSIFVSVALIKPVNVQLSDYLGYALSSQPVQSSIISKGIGLQHIHLEDMRKVMIPIPPLAEQQQIVDEAERHISVVNEIEAQVNANLKRAARLRQGILKRAFEGRLVPQDPNDEPAEQLLARIREQRQTASPSKNGSPRTRQQARTRKEKPALPLFTEDDGDNQGGTS